jgi:hypothetical protein
MKVKDWSKTFKEEILAIEQTRWKLAFSAYEMYIHALYRIYGQDLLDEKKTKLTLTTLFRQTAVIEVSNPKRQFAYQKIGATRGCHAF